MSTKAGKYASIANGAKTVIQAIAIKKYKVISNPLVYEL